MLLFRKYILELLNFSKVLVTYQKSTEPSKNFFQPCTNELGYLEPKTFL